MSEDNFCLIANGFEKEAMEILSADPKMSKDKGFLEFKEYWELAEEKKCQKTTGKM